MATSGKVNHGDHPRVRGERVDVFVDIRVDVGSPPRARGADDLPPRLQVRLGITPACAGSGIGVRPGGRCTRDHPRVRGERRVARSLAFLRVGSPPRARGAGFFPVDYGPFERITPACAGSGAGTWRAMRRTQDHPRVRGERRHTSPKPVCSGGSPPRARGAGFLTCSSEDQDDGLCSLALGGYSLGGPSRRRLGYT